TKKYPHENHPANYVRRVGDNVEYITFTHSPEVHLSNGATIQTVPMADNVSKVERDKAKREGKTRFETRSYAYPVVFVGKRSALDKEIVGEFEPIPFDKVRIGMLFTALPRVSVAVTGGNGKFKRFKGDKKAPK
ncbi:MAG: hypothetical protein K2N47_00070, partial [Clostridia bacterium]|nr:hypothetical protein [Clostridia bacterium]